MTGEHVRLDYHMKPSSLRRLKQILRSPTVIVGEIAAIALAGVLGATVPPLHVFSSAWFLAVTLLTAASLGVVVVEQVRRLRIMWSQRLTADHFEGAPFRAEFERLARLAPADAGSRIRVWTEMRAGLAGSAVLHTGLLLVIVAGALRTLFATDAVVDLVEGETLAPTSGSWAAQWPGMLAQPFRLDVPVTLNSVRASRYDTGDLRDLRVRLAFQRKEGIQDAEIAVNRDVKTAGGRLFPSADFGPAALVEWQKSGIPATREAALLAGSGKGTFEGSSAGPDGLRAHLRAQVDSVGNHPASVDVRVMKDRALLFTGDVRPGETIAVLGGVKLTLHGTPFWARLRGSRDPALGLVYLGFALVLAGVVLVFTVVKVDVCVAITPAGDRERVFVAIKPQRFEPLFRERFERLVREQSDPAGRETPQPRCAPAALPVRVSLANMPALLLLVLVLTSCGRSDLEKARKLVEHYNRVVSEAYRRGDVKLIDGVVGPNEGKKLTGLIGVRLDLGFTLDAQLLSLEVTGVGKAKDELRVRTKERWRYRDLKIGSGEQVGEESVDAYEMLYVFKKMGGAWLVDEIQFATPPQIGRKQPLWLAERVAPHGMAAQAAGVEGKQP